MQTLASMQFLSAAERRRLVDKYARHLPRDIAAATVLLTVPSQQPISGHDHRPTKFKEHLSTHDSGFDVFTRSRVLAPLIEPNTFHTGRLITVNHACPDPVADPTDGVPTATWDSPAQHADALARTIAWYRSHHDITEQIAHPMGERHGFSGGRLDSWHSPLLAVPVRHVYRDGSPGRTGFYAADGSARIVGCRVAFAEQIASFAPDHPWADANRLWPLDTASLRSLAAAARAYDPPERWDVPHILSDYADIAVPSVETTAQVLKRLGLWLLRSHGSEGTVPAGHYPEQVVTYIEDLDLFVGDSPGSLLGVDPSSVAGRREISDVEDGVRSWLMVPSTNMNEVAKKIAFMLVATCDPRTAPAGKGLLGAYVARLCSDVSVGSNGRLDTGFWTAAVPQMMIAQFGAPRLSDLYGVWGDLTAGSLDDPLDDPGSDWFWLTAAQAVASVALRGHLAWGERGLAELAALLDSPLTLIDYAAAVQAGIVPSGNWVSTLLPTQGSAAQA